MVLLMAVGLQEVLVVLLVLVMNILILAVHLTHRLVVQELVDTEAMLILMLKEPLDSQE